MLYIYALKPAGGWRENGSNEVVSRSSFSMVLSRGNTAGSTLKNFTISGG
jgi:hypothetical protein